MIILIALGIFWLVIFVNTLGAIIYYFVAKRPRDKLSKTSNEPTVIQTNRISQVSEDVEETPEMVTQDSVEEVEPESITPTNMIDWPSSITDKPNDT
jgi:hypothetical protein